MATVSTSAKPPESSPSIPALLEGIGHDVRAIAVNEVELARVKLTDFMQQLAIKASVALLASFVALTGLAMLCIVVVVALEPVIAALWLRLLIMAVVYIGVGAGATAIYMRRLMAMHGPDLSKAKAEIGHTVKAVEHGLEH